MMSDHNTKDHQADDLRYQGIRQVWDRLTAPHFAIENSADQHKARLLSTFLILIIGLFLASDLYAFVVTGTNPIEFPMVVGYPLLIVAYFLSRTQYNWIGALLAVSMFIGFSFALVFQQNDPSLALTYLIPGLLLASMFFSVRGTAVTMGIVLLGMLLLPVIAPERIPSLQTIGAGFSINLMTGVLLLAAMWHRTRIENDRLSALSATNEAPTQSRDALEDRAAGRTHDIEQAVAALQASQEQLALAVEGSNDGIWDWDIQNDKIYLSPRWKEMIGYEDDEINHEFAQFESRLHPDDHDRVMQALTDYLEGKADSYEVETRLQHKDGTYRWVWARGMAQRDSNGVPVRMTGFHTDITRRKHSEEELNSSLSLLQSTLESTAYGILVTDGQGRVIRLNRRFLEMWQIPTELSEAQDGEKLIDFVREQLVDPDQFVATVHELYSQPEADSVDELYFKDGRIFERHSRPQQITSQVIGRVWSFRDVTACKRVESNLNDSLSLLQATLEATADGILVTDEQGHVTRLNQRFLEMWQIPAELSETEDDEKLIGFVREQLADPDQFMAKVRELHIQPEADSFDVLYLKDDRIFERYSQPQQVAGQVVGRVWSFHDVTKRAQVEQLVQGEQVRTHAVLESITVPLVISRVSDGKIAYVNEPLAEIIRIPRDELIGQLTPDFYDDLDVRQRYLTSLHKQGRVDNFDLRLKRADGTLLWVLISGRMINFQGEQAIITSFIDITERRKAQAALAHRTAELETLAEVGMVAASILEPNQLLQQVVDLTKERFGLSQAFMFLLNENETELILEKGAGNRGRAIVANGYRLLLSQQKSLVVRAAHTRKGLIINDVHSEPDFLPHASLPDTQAEMAVPLIAGDHLIGVLDVQADQVDYFTLEDVSIFTTLAAQVAVALQNARRYADAQRALDDLTRLQRVLAREGWEAFLLAQERPFAGFAFGDDGIKPITNSDGVVTPVEETTGETTTVHAETAVDPAETSVSIPIAVRGEKIGQLGLRTPDGSPIPERKQMLLETVAQQVSEALERARLAEQTQVALTKTEDQSRRLAHLNEMGAELIAANTMDEAFKAIGRHMDDIVNNNGLSLTLLEPDGDILKLFPLGEQAGAIQTDTEFPVTGTSMGAAITQRQPVNLPDIRHSDYLESKRLVKLGLYSTLAVPLITSRGTLGTLNVGSNTVNAFDAQDVNLVQQIASLLASTIESYRLFQQAQRRASELETVAQVGTAASTILETKNLLQSVVDLTKARFGLYHAHIYRFDEATNMLVLAAGAGKLGQQMMAEAWSIPLNQQQSLVARAARERQGVIVNDVLTDPDYLPNPLLIETRSETAVPMIVGNQLLGVLDLQSAEPHHFTEDDVRIYATLTAQVAVAMQNASQYEQTQAALAETRRQARRLALLNKISERISQADSLEKIYEITVAEAAQIFPADRVSLSLLNQEGDQAQVIAVEGESGSVPIGTPQAIAGSLTEKAIRAKRALMVNDPDPDPQRTINSAMIVPLTIGDETIGTINIGSKQVNLYNDQDENLIFQLTSLLSAAVDNQRLYDEQASTVEELRRLDHLRSTFLANMSHELRTPLNSVIGFTDVILEGLDGPLTDMMEADLQIIRKNGHHLLHLIGDVLDMAKIEAGRMDIAFERLDLVHVIADVMDISAPLAREKNLDLQFLNDSTDALEIVGDSNRLKQVLLNLIGNAIKFTEEGSVTVEVTRTDDFVQIGVRDTGVGISPDQMVHVFEAFRQVDNSATRKVGGTGLGLAISRQLIELHGGKIWAESSGVSGEGATFIIELPMGDKAMPEVNTQ